MAAAEGLFPEGGPVPGVGGGGPSVPGVPAGGSGLADGAGDAGADYARRWGAVSGADGDTSAAAGSGAAVGASGRAGATGVRLSARSVAAAIGPATGSPAGVHALVSAMDERLGAMQRQIDATRAQYRVLALRLRQVAMAYRMAGMAGSGGGMPGLGGGMPGLGGAGMPAALGGGGIPGLSTALAGLTHVGQRDDGDRWAGPDGLRLGGSGSERAERAVDAARTKLGSPYVWGASGPRAFDCSGLVRWAYRQAGVDLPRTTYALMHVGEPVSAEGVRAGDLILSNFSGPGRPEHVQLAVSPTMVIEAPVPGGHVQISHIPSGRIAVRRVV